MDSLRIPFIIQNSVQSTFYQKTLPFAVTKKMRFNNVGVDHVQWMRLKFPRKNTFSRFTLRDNLLEDNFLKCFSPCR